MLKVVKGRRRKVMGDLKKWRDQDWVRVGTDGKIKGACGTSKDKKNPDRCLPRSKANSLSQGQRATTAKKKKREGAKGKTVVKNTKAATVKLAGGGLARRKRDIARGCGAVMEDRRKATLYTLRRLVHGHIGHHSV